MSCSVPSILRSNRFRRDARALEEDEEMWFNEDEEEESETVIPPVEKSKSEDDFPDSYEKFMETKKGILLRYCINKTSSPYLQNVIQHSHCHWKILKCVKIPIN